MNRHILGDKFKTQAGSIFLPAFTVGLFLVLFLLYRPSRAAGGSFIVNSTADTDDGTCNAANCTLREAIHAANAAAGADTITFSLPQNATITLGGTQLPPIVDDLTIDGSTAVNLTISGNDASRVLVVGPEPPPYPGAQGNGPGGSTAVTLTNLIITRGNEAADRGGGIYNSQTLVIQNSAINNVHSKEGGIFNEGSLTISNSSLANNKVTTNSGGGAAIYNDSTGVITITNSTFNANTVSGSTLSGGAISNDRGDVTISNSVFSNNLSFGIAGISTKRFGALTIRDSVFTDNLAGAAVGGGSIISVTNTTFSGNTGGALYASGLAFVRDSFFANNSSDSQGGALHIDLNGRVTVWNSVFSGNHNDQSGGAISAFGDLKVFESLFRDNTSDGSGGAIYSNSGYGPLLTIDETTFFNNSAENGGALYASGTTTIYNSTISNNSAQNRGGGIYNDRITSLNNTTINGNGANNGGGIYNANSLEASNTIIANSFSGGDCVNIAAIQTNINNLIEDGSCNPALSGDPQLGFLQDNGGLMLTHSPLAGSIAIDSGDDAACLAKDQRGIPRPVDGDVNGTAVCDIGAVEKANYLEVNSANDVSTGICNNSHCSLREAILAANGSSGVDVIIFNIPGPGPHTIQPLAPLPNITGPLVIDGYTETGAAPNATPGRPGDSAVMKIELDGSSAGPSASGLTLTGPFGVVRGLVINRFGEHGIQITGSGAAGNVVAGNFIGTNVTGDAGLANGGANVFIGASASGNRIGGEEPEDGNIIAFAGTNGVAVASGGAAGNVVRSNAIFDNGSLGIDLADDGVTGNDPGDGDAGPNDLQNYPVLSLATADVGQTTIQGSLDSAPLMTYTVEFFANTACDGSGNGEGERPLRTALVATDGGGGATFDISVPMEVPSNQLVSATATDPAGSVSEFSECIVVVDAPISGLTATNNSPTMVRFPTSLSASILTGGNVNYLWDFGDGASGSGQNVAHYYQAIGVYTAVVTAGNSVNTLTATTVVSITEYIPTSVSVAGFGSDPPAGRMIWPLAAAIVGGVVLVLVFGRYGRAKRGA